MGRETTSDDRILTEAARWHARLAAEDCTDFDRIEFQRWWTQSPRNAQAYEAAEALSAQLSGAALFDERLQAMADEAFAMGSDDEVQLDSRPMRAPTNTRAVQARRWAVPAALAAGIAAAFIGVQLSGYFTKAPPSVTYASAEQARREVTLPDGSVVHLDVDSEVKVSFSSRRRDIVLTNGRALFEVARDPSRPFAVLAGESRTLALGTHFQVQREGQNVLVTLTEGSIAVTSETEQSAWREQLVPGEQVSLSTDGRTHVKRAVDAQAVTSWSRGRLVFRGTPLGEALQEVNRYGSRKVRLGDPELADLPVDGNFIAGETDLIVSAFAAVLPLRVAEDSGGEIILFRRYKAEVP